MFYGPQIRQLVKDEHLIEHNFKRMLDWRYQKPSWFLIMSTELLQRLLEIYKMLGCKMSNKLQFLHSHLADFLKNLGAVSDEQSELFHQDLKIMEARIYMLYTHKN